MKQKLTIVTGNALKFRELAKMLGDFFEYEQREIDGYEIQGTSEEILKNKLEQAYPLIKGPVLVDDTAMEIEELGGFPGPYIKDFSKKLTIPGIGKKYAGSRVSVISYIGIIFSPGEYIIGKGILSGTIVEPRAERPHGSLDFDPIIIPDGYNISFAEMSVEEKNAISHRGRALKDLLEKIKK